MEEPFFPHQLLEEEKLLPLGIRDFMSQAPSYPPVLIEGLLRQREILLMGGQAKRWKSWARADMLYCIANGLDWLGFPTHQGLVIHFDLELLEADLRWRFEQIHSSYAKEGCKGTLQNLRYVPLRGVPFSMADLESHIEELKNPHYACLSVDPIYRLLGGKGESDPIAVADLLTRFLAIGAQIKAAIALLQHFTKGDQSLKESQDRFSGTGIWNRFPDALLTFTDLETENCFSCEFTLRSFEHIEPFAVRWEFPRFRVDEKLDPENLKPPKGRPRKTSLEEFCAVLTPSESLSYTELWARVEKILHISLNTFKRRLKDAKDQHFIYLSPATNQYGLTPNYLKNNGQLP